MTKWLAHVVRMAKHMNMVGDPLNPPLAGALFQGLAPFSVDCVYQLTPTL